MDPIKHALDTCLQRGLTFAAFRRNGTVELWVSRHAGLVRSYWDELSQEEDIFLVAPFKTDPERCTFLKAAIRIDLGAGDLDLTALDQAEGSVREDPANGTHWDAEGHAAAILEVQERMESGEIQKVVLSRTKEINADIRRTGELFVNALKEQPEAFICLLNCPEYGTWLGASPEMLVHAQGDQVRVDSIAGTLPLKAAPAHAEDWGGKEREEQALVTRSVLDTFINMGLQEVSVCGPSLLKAAHVAHLHTTLKAGLGQVALTDLVKSLHPTPAVCGTPREKAMAEIIRLEPHDRSLYAGFWGPWRSKGASQLYVNIRCMRLLDQRAVLYIGGGITAGSEPEKEWAETEHKALTWQRPLEALHMERT